MNRIQVHKYFDIISMDPVEKIDTLVRGHPKTSGKSTQTKLKAPKLFYAVAFGRKIGVFSNKWVETECLTKHYKGSRCLSFKNTQDAWIYILDTNKDASLPNSLYDYYRLSEDKISHFRNEIEKVKITKANKKRNLKT